MVLVGQWFWWFVYFAVCVKERLPGTHANKHCIDQVCSSQADLVLR